MDQSSLASMKALRGKSIIECLEECERIDCHYVQQETPGECRLYDKRAYFHLESVVVTTESSRGEGGGGGEGGVLYHRKIYARKEYGGFRLSQHFKQVSSVENGDKCWEECLKERVCEVASFNYASSDCFFYKNGEYVLESESDEDFISYSIEKIHLKRKNPTTKTTLITATTSIAKINSQFVYNNTILRCEYRIYSTQSIQECWDKCLVESTCHAISFKNGVCYLHKKDSCVAGREEN